MATVCTPSWRGAWLMVLEGMRGNVWIVALVCGCVVWSLACAVSAQRVAVVRPQAGDGVVLNVYYRLRAELRIHDFEAVAVDWDGSSLDASDVGPALAQLAEDHEARAVLALSRRDGQVTLAMWLLDQRRRSSVRSLSAEPNDDAASLLALRAVDLLRMALQPGAAQSPDASRTDRRPRQPVALEPAQADVPPDTLETEADETPPPDDEAATAQPPRRLWLSASALLLRPGDRFGVALGPQLGIAYRVLPWFELSLQLAGPIAGARLTTTAGYARIYQELAWLEARLFALRAGGFELAFALGGGAYFMQASAEVAAPLLARDDQIWSWSITGGVHAGYQLSSRWMLGLGLRAIAWLPRVGVAVANESALVDEPAFVAGLGLAFGL